MSRERASTYKSRASLASRASAAEAAPDDHGPTGLDPVRLTDDALIAHSVEHDRRVPQPKSSRGRSGAAWVLTAALAVAFVLAFLWIRQGWG